eukprot:GHVU01086613.1.p1 GENE.GHVU01086613.1~~GHVU01086613.1.p1  ORF type:complete len:127 (-),score=31.69 GHVU01086613.1:80-460(-)
MAAAHRRQKLFGEPSDVEVAGGIADALAADAEHKATKEVAKLLEKQLLKLTAEREREAGAKQVLEDELCTLQREVDRLQQANRLTEEELSEVKTLVVKAVEAVLSDKASAKKLKYVGEGVSDGMSE